MPPPRVNATVESAWKRVTKRARILTSLVEEASVCLYQRNAFGHTFQTLTHTLVGQQQGSCQVGAENMSITRIRLLKRRKASILGTPPSKATGTHAGLEHPAMKRRCFPSRDFAARRLYTATRHRYETERLSHAFKVVLNTTDSTARPTTPPQMWGVVGNPRSWTLGCRALPKDEDKETGRISCFKDLPKGIESVAVGGVSPQCPGSQP